MQKFAAVLVMSLVVACAGRAERTEGAGGQSDVPAAAGGSSATGGGNGVFEGRGGDGSRDCKGSLPTCVLNCESGEISYSGFACRNGKYECGSPRDVDSSTCPIDTPGSCAGKEQPDCRKSCASTEMVAPDCVDGAYECPSDSVERETCPENSCAQSEQATCCFADGTYSSSPACKADGTLNCPEGSKPTIGQCVPQEEPKESCTDREGRACSSDNLTCKQSRCVSCVCEPNESGALVWQCIHNPC